MSTKCEESVAIKPSSPWGSLPSTQVSPSSFTAVMDEEYAKQLQEKEEDFEVYIPDEEENIYASAKNEETTDDLLLAQMLQLEFDKEHDSYLKAREKIVNKDSKVTMSFEKYSAVHPYERHDETSSDSSTEADEDELYDGDEEESRKVTNKRQSGPGCEIITKHDAIICGRRNARNVENFPSNFASGNFSDKDIRLPNNVYNKLKQHSIKEEKYSHKVHEKKEHSTHDQALDAKTRLIMYKLVNSEVLDTINGCVSTGKEAVVFHANGGQLEGRTLPAECVLKVYKTTLNEFKTRDKYIKDDFRFRDRYSKQNPRKIIRLWAEKEMRNLKRMYEHKINCPEVVLLRKHILVMSFIGINQKPAPKLKDVHLSHSQYTSAYQQCIQMMQKMYKVCNLIHADLSEYNMLWHAEKVWFIDVSQSIEPTHPRALEFLVRDCTNVVSFFTKMEISEVMSVEELFNFVSGLKIKGEKESFLNQIREFEKDEELLTCGVSENSYPFDYLFNRTVSDTKEEGEEERTG